MRLVLVILCLVGLSLANASDRAAASGAPNAAKYFQVHFDVERDGTSVGTSSAVVERGKEASVRYQEPEGGAGLRLDFSVDPLITETGIGTAYVKMVVYELSSGAWQLLAEPSIQAFLDGREAAIDVATEERSTVVKVQVEIMPANVLSVKFGGSIPDATQGGVDSSSGPSASLMGGGAPNCCTGFCKPPPGTMTCCGAISCCACGVCCQVL